MKHVFIITIGALSLLSTAAEAKPGKCDPTQQHRMFLNDVELSDAQQEQLSALKKDKRNTNESRKSENGKSPRKHLGEQAWIAAFADGEKRRRQILREIEAASRSNIQAKEERHQLGLRHKQDWTDFLYSYSTDQRAQVEENFEHHQERCQPRQEARREKMEAKMTKHQQRGQKRQQRVRALMAADMELSDRQERQLSALIDAKYAQKIEQHASRKELSKQRQREHREWVEAFLDGENPSLAEQLERHQEIKEEAQQEHLTRQLRQAEQWMDFIEALSTDQRDQLIDNLEELKKKHKKHRQRPSKP